jgi:signal transduction histidine kinase
MVCLHQGYRSPYYAGIMLVVVAAGTLFRWNFNERLLTYGTICLSYFSPILAQRVTEPPILISNSFFLLSTVIIVAAAQAHSVKVARSEFFANLDLQATKASLETAFERLKELDRLKSQFFSNITHELRTPLTMILAPLEGLLDGEFGNLRPHQREYLRPIRQNALKLLKLINDLLDLAKIDEQFLRLRVEQTDLTGLINEIIEQTQPLAARKDILLELEIISTKDDLFVDADRMERALVNILSNALKFTAPGGRVKLWMDTSEMEVLVGVRDSGIGIADDQLDHIFERFSQGDGSVTRQYGGTGIGLALAKEIVELHGGNISVTSCPGSGSEFVIHLKRGESHFRPDVLDRRQSTRPSSVPRRGDDREPREWTRMLIEHKDYRYLEIQEVTERRVAVRGNGTHKANRILVVEDNADVLRFVNMQLNDEHEVYLAPDGLKGLELALRELPDVIITDYMMPEMDGVTLIRHLRDDPRTKDIPVIMLTAKSQVQDRVDAREAGAEIFLRKPFSPKELRAAINQLLEQRGRQVSRALHEQVKSLEHISAGLAHEIHNPLNYIRSALFVIEEVFAEMRNAANDPEQQSAVAALVRESEGRVERMHEIAQKGVSRIARVVELVRNYAREGYIREPSAIDVDTMIGAIAPLLSPASDQIVSVELDLQSDGAQVLCIAEDLQQSIGNLWQNALDALGPGGRVVIRTRADAESVLIEVEDNGPGIPREQLGQIFVPFFTTKSPGKGLGLGLSISYQVVNQAGGTITVNCGEPRGTTFRVSLPRHASKT